MVGESPALQNGPRLAGHHPSRTRDAFQLDDWLPPLIQSGGFHVEWIRLDDEIRRASEFLLGLPLRRIRPLHGRRKIRAATERRSAIDPTSERFDLVVAQRDVVLEFLDTDGLVDVP